MQELQETQVVGSLGQEGPWGRKWQPTPVLPGNSHGQKSLASCSPCSCKELDTAEHACITGLVGMKLWSHCGFEWFALETKRDHSVVYESESKYCTLDSFVDCDGYSISSKGFLPRVIDVMVI